MVIKESGEMGWVGAREEERFMTGSGDTQVIVAEEVIVLGRCSLQAELLDQ